MSAERISQIKEQLVRLDKHIRQLDWDLNRNQINEFQKKKLGILRTEHATLTTELHQLSPAATHQHEG